MLVDAVIRNLEIIGEAVKHIPQSIKREYETVDWKGIVGLRNILSHGYFTVNYPALWKTITEEVPKLREDINLLLEAEKKKPKKS